MDLTAVRHLLTRPRVLTTLVVLVALLIPLLYAVNSGGNGVQRARLTAQDTHHTYLRLAGPTLARGTHRGTVVTDGTLRIGTPLATIRRGRFKYQVANWLGPWTTPSSTFTQAVPSWHITTPAASWVRIWVRAKDTTGRVSTWKDLGTWSTRDGRIKRSSGAARPDAVATLDTDTLLARTGVTLQSWQIRIRLAKAPAGKTPRVTSLGAVTSYRSGTSWPVPTTSRPLSTTPVTLNVPTYSQMTHRGQNPEYGNGGEAWCSPTSLAMVLGYYGRLPAPASYAWVKPPNSEPWVNHLARLTYDQRYEGTGNWPFNTAIGAARTGDGFVTRLDDLRMAESFIRAGIPLILSTKWSKGQLRGAAMPTSTGHLLVLVGFDAQGNPVINDPAGATNTVVRRTYDRAEFERAWLGGSGGLTYVVRDAAHPLPAKTATNW